MRIRVLLVDDNVLFRGGLAQIMEGDGRFQVVGQASRGPEAVAAVSKLRPDLVLLDLRMPGMGGVEAIRRIRAEYPQIPIGVLTVFESEDSVQSALEAGASGYLAKDSTSAELCEAAVELAGGKRLSPPLRPAAQFAGVARPSGKLDRLTARELEVLRALVSGAGNDAIARRLGISPKTLRNHISNTYHKLHIFDRAQAVIVALREGLVELPGRSQPVGEGKESARPIG